MLSLFLILIFIRPFISSLASPFKNLVYSILLLSFLAAWIIIKGIQLNKIKAIRLPLILFILSLAISLLFSYNIAISIGELYKYLAAILLLCLCASLSEKEKSRVILYIVLAGLIVSLRAIHQYFFGFQNLLSYATKKGISDPFVLDYISRKRPFYPFVTPNVLAGYLAMIIPLALTQKYRLWLIIPLSCALILTKSLGALLSLFLGLVIYVTLKGNLKKRNIFFLAGLLIIMAGVLISRNVAQKLHTQPIFSLVMRLNYWQDTLSIIKLHPLTGVGLGNFNLAQSRYSHNSYLQIWAEMGILGIVSFLWLIITLLKSQLKALKDSLSNAQASSLIAASLVFLLHNLVDFTFFLPEVSLIWWAILGLLIG